MLTPDEIATIRTRCEKTVLRCSYEAAGTGRHNDYKRDVSALLDHIQAQSEQLRQVQAERALMRQALECADELWGYLPFDSGADIQEVASQVMETQADALSSTPAITAYAERVARMEEALQEIAEESPVRLDGWARNRALSALEGAD